MTKPYRQPVQVDPEVYARVKEYSDRTGVPVARAVNRAIGEWLDQHGKQHMQALALKPRK